MLLAIDYYFIMRLLSLHYWHLVAFLCFMVPSWMLLEPPCYYFGSF